MIQFAKCLLAVRGIVDAGGLIAVDSQVPFTPRGDVDLKPVLADDRSVAWTVAPFPSAKSWFNFQCGLPAATSTVFSRLVTGFILQFVCRHSVLFGRITRISERIDPLA